MTWHLLWHAFETATLKEIHHLTGITVSPGKKDSHFDERVSHSEACRQARSQAQSIRKKKSCFKNYKWNIWKVVIMAKLKNVYRTCIYKKHKSDWGCNFFFAWLFFLENYITRRFSCCTHFMQRKKNAERRRCSVNSHLQFMSVKYSAKASCTHSKKNGSSVNSFSELVVTEVVRAVEKFWTTWGFKCHAQRQRVNARSVRIFHSSLCHVQYMTLMLIYCPLPAK